MCQITAAFIIFYLIFLVNIVRLKVLEFAVHLFAKLRARKVIAWYLFFVYWFYNFIFFKYLYRFWLIGFWFLIRAGNIAKMVLYFTYLLLGFKFSIIFENIIRWWFLTIFNLFICPLFLFTQGSKCLNSFLIVFKQIVFYALAHSRCKIRRFI